MCPHVDIQQILDWPGWSCKPAAIRTEHGSIGGASPWATIKSCKLLPKFGSQTHLQVRPGNRLQVTARVWKIIAWGCQVVSKRPSPNCISLCLQHHKNHSELRCGIRSPLAGRKGHSRRLHFCQSKHVAEVFPQTLSKLWQQGYTFVDQPYPLDHVHENWQSRPLSVSMLLEEEEEEEEEGLHPVQPYRAD